MRMLCESIIYTCVSVDEYTIWLKVILKSIYILYREIEPLTAARKANNNKLGEYVILYNKIFGLEAKRRYIFHSV